MVKAEATRLWVKTNSAVISVILGNDTFLPFGKQIMRPFLNDFASWQFCSFLLLWSNCATIKPQQLPFKIAHSRSLARTIYPHAKTPGTIPITFSLETSIFNVQYIPGWEDRRIMLLLTDLCNIPNVKENLHIKGKTSPLV